MYERSAIVLERYIEKILDFNKTYNLKKNNQNYNDLIEEIEKYQTVTEQELKIMQEFDDTAKRIESLQKEQKNLYKSNKKLEDDRTQLFGDLGEDAKTLESKLKKIENALEKNNEEQREIREEFIQYLSDFSQKQKERNKCEKAKRVGEAKHIEFLKKMHIEFEEINVRDIVTLKDFVNSEKEQVKKETLEIMIKNGKSERVAFNQDVLRKAINTRIDIAEKEAECYVVIYDRMKKLLAEIDNDTLKINKFKKALRDTSVKLAFLEAEKEYIVGFLDYERMTAISGTRAHNKMMVEACNNFELDMIQIKDLYELILKEITNKATKKAYKELYNKTYLKNIEDKEKNFEEEVNNVNISVGTVINSNYWRIEGIKNIYNVFQEEVSKKFEKDLSEYRIEEPKEEIEEEYIEEYEEDYAYDEEEEEDDDTFNYEDTNRKEEVYEKNKSIYQEEEDDDKEDDEYENFYIDEDEEEYGELYEEEEEAEEEEEYKNIYKYQYDEEDDEEEYDDEEDYDDFEEEASFDDEDSLEAIIEKSRKKAIKNNNKKDNKGLFNKFFKK